MKVNTELCRPIQVGSRMLIPFFTRGGCMRPLLKNGELVFVEQVGMDKIKPGDCILYNSGLEYFLHRVEKKQENSFMVNDDTGIVGLHKVDFKEVIGRLTANHFPAKGWLGLIYGRIIKTIFWFSRNLIQPLSRKF